MTRAAIIGTGVANTASVAACLRRCGLDPFVTDERDAVERERLVVLPGVGAFGAGASFLDTHDLREALRERIRADRPTLAVCLGMQLLGASSEETPGVAGLGIVDVGATRFPAGVTVPHFGWNTVDPESGFGGCERGYAYFANSYRFELGADDAPEGWAVATSDHGGRFIAAMRRGAVLACQFHPELSGAWGAALIRGWAEYADRPRGPSPAPRGAAC